MIIRGNRQLEENYHRLSAGDVFIGRPLSGSLRLALLIDLLEQAQFLGHHALQHLGITAAECRLFTLQDGLERLQSVQAGLHGRGKGSDESLRVHELLRLAEAGLEGEHFVGHARRLDLE